MNRARKVLVCDYIICCAVFLQSALSILQILLSSVYGINPEETTVYRVVLTAVPMVLAILISAFRRSQLFVFTYFIVSCILLFHGALFPENIEYMKIEAPRFLLPVVIASTLCLISVKNTKVILRSATIMSWLTTILVLVYVSAFFRRLFIFENYNMTFGYGCLLPMMILYHIKKIPSLLASVFLFFVVIAIGSRGAAIIFVLYVVVDLFRSRSSYRWLLLALGVVAILLLPLFESFLDAIGITSRTLSSVHQGELTDAHGRESLYPFFINILLQNPILGIGLYGDRIATHGSYCHNLFLEIFLDFGFVFGAGILLFFIWFLIKSSKLLRGEDKNLWLLFMFLGVGPLMVSGSYLLSTNLAIFIGYSINAMRSQRHIGNN